MERLELLCVAIDACKEHALESYEPEDVYYWKEREKLWTEKLLRAEILPAK